MITHWINDTIKENVLHMCEPGAERAGIRKYYTVKTANDTVVMMAETEDRYASITGRLEPEAILDKTGYFLVLLGAKSFH